MNDAALIEELNAVVPPDLEGTRQRAVRALVADGHKSTEETSRMKRWLLGLLGIAGVGVIVVSPVGQAVADLVTGGDDPPSPPPLSKQDVAISKIACSELGSEAATVSWCDGLGASSAEVEALLESKGYELFTEGPIIAVKSPDGTVMVTGTGDGPEDLKGIDFPIHLWGGWLAGPTDQDALDLVEKLRGSPAGAKVEARRDERGEQSK